MNDELELETGTTWNNHSRSTHNITKKHRKEMETVSLPLETLLVEADDGIQVEVVGQLVAHQQSR